MKCPFCGLEMEEGVLEGQRYLLWAKRHHKVSYRPEEGEVLLGEKMINSVTLPASICKRCQRIILEYPKRPE